MTRIRAATVADADAIAEVHVRTWQVGYRGLLPDAVLDAIDPVVRAARWRDTLTDLPPHNVVAVAVDAGTVVGFVRAGRARDETTPHEGEVYAIYVHPAHWGTGAGRGLMDTAVTHLTGAGYSPIRLWALAGNARARRFYERYGYVADGATGSHPVGDTEAPIVRFTLTGT